MLRLINPIRRYDWGSTTAIPDLLGTAPDGDPQAELWMGAHPDSPSTLPDGMRLDEAILADPVGLLGAAVRDTFGDRLPYLAKVLAAESALSLQVHPDADQAAAGFAAEEAGEVPRDARERRYKDPFHKPEMVIALEPFDALCGWRNPATTRALMAELQVDDPGWAHLDGMLAADDPAAALRAAVQWLLSDAPRAAGAGVGRSMEGDGGGDEAGVEGLVHAVGDAAARRPDVADMVTVADLATRYPGDPGVVVAMLLNRVTLMPGEALYLPAGNVHAYLRGTAVEVMAASDNVLRAGLTSKYVDPPELIRTVDWTPLPLPYVHPDRRGVWDRYAPAAAEFAVTWADLCTVGPAEQGIWHDGPSAGPRVLLALHGPVEVRASGEVEGLAAGQSLLVPDVDGPLQVRGSGTAVVVSVPQA